MSNFIQARTKKLAVDLFKIQLVWTLWYIPIVIVGTLFALNISWIGINGWLDIDIEHVNIFFTITQTSRGFLIVTSLIMFLYLFSHFIQNGLTRREVFRASSFAAVGLVITIMITAIFLNSLFNFFSWHAPMPQLTILALPEWAIPIMMSLILISYYLGGWLVAVGFYRFKFLGILFVPIGLLLVFIVEFVWQAEASFLGFIDYTNPSPSLSIAAIVTLVLIGLTLYSIRALTKQMPIKPH
ncbi:hypothetical protein SAMN04488134_10788 [Amphibacillus marinus]|uniref:ABC-2 family transporter protein n=1 Tax=Amphibacillus marinus TaxID=872970 RepID=A0A1H8PJB4_9BACI|nr:hypothetical protein [Amphibacillus marinus]SEO41758.1 hypothetical protein SAMN04488134_10788 [Amphibacillus marinus]